MEAGAFAVLADISGKVFLLLFGEMVKMIDYRIKIHERIIVGRRSWLSLVVELQKNRKSREGRRAAGTSFYVLRGLSHTHIQITHGKFIAIPNRETSFKIAQIPSSFRGHDWVDT